MQSVLVHLFSFMTFNFVFFYTKVDLSMLHMFHLGTKISSRDNHGLWAYLQQAVTALAAVRSLYSRYMLWVPERELYLSHTPKFLIFRGFFSYTYTGTIIGIFLNRGLWITIAPYTPTFSPTVYPFLPGVGNATVYKMVHFQTEGSEQINKHCPLPHASDTTTPWISMLLAVTHYFTQLHIMTNLSSPSFQFHVPTKNRCQLIQIKLQWPYALGCNQLWQKQKADTAWGVL